MDNMDKNFLDFLYGKKVTGFSSSNMVADEADGFTIFFDDESSISFDSQYFEGNGWCSFNITIHNPE